ncbi:hypothetical protein D910_00520 [Dendroctonus ponderosae]|uniref:PiggyBac transposable element-derived protein domain-containing protein n=1 Tax=Dendroctonus ponderosae TaxID=77166 RepID=U4UTP5_DENPD|nr:hypothetical protein D910_00520 [Dendroctonus ponderosae]
MIFTLGECHKNCLLASRVYAQKIPERNDPKPTLCQELYGNDFENRSEFCTCELDKVAENEKCFENVLFSDECTFHNNGLVSRHNFHYYSDTNTLAYTVIKNQNRWSVNVWRGILGQYLIGLCFLKDI